MDTLINVLVVDDSAFMRKMVSEILASDPALRVVGTARDGADALVKIHDLKPRVVTLDIEMPGMNGYAVLERLADRPAGSPPLAILMLSSLTQAGADATMRCLDLGAVDVIGKPSGAISLDIKAVSADVIAKVKAAAGARVSLIARRFSPPRPAAPSPVSLTPFAHPPRPSVIAPVMDPSRGILLIGSSTGGPRALQTVVPALDPARLGMPIVIVQHMPPNFTASLAARLEMLAPNGLRVARGRVGRCSPTGPCPGRPRWQASDVR